MKILFFAGSAIIAPIIVAATPAPAGLVAADLEALRAIDLRLATIAHRLALANADLCREKAPATGMILHAATQYDADTQEAARRVFAFHAPISVAAVVPGSAAARAGVIANDGVTAIGGIPLTGSATPPSSADRDAALDVLERQSGDVQLDVARERNSASRIIVAAPMACRARFDVQLGPAMMAQADRKVVQIGVRFFERYRDEETAVIVAHELAHIMLRHRIRLEAAGIKGGLLSEVGRNARVGQRAELEADELGVALLYNAGYDPASAARFWREHGGDLDGGMFRSRTHPATRRRIEVIERAAAAITPGHPKPYVPAVLEQRDSPIGD